MSDYIIPQIKPKPGDFLRPNSTSITLDSQNRKIFAAVIVISF